jgi:uncharacterized membrane protein
VTIVVVIWCKAERNPDAGPVMIGRIEAAQETAWRQSMHFPASVLKSRSFGFGLGLQIAFAVFVGLANPAPAAAQLKVCNNTKTEIMVVYSESLYGADGYEENMKTTTKGFYKIDAGECPIIDSSSLSLHVYLYAWEPSNPNMSWNGGEYNVYLHCVPDNHKTNFEYHDHEKYNPPCGAGQVREGFLMVPKGGRTDFTEVS